MYVLCPLEASSSNASIGEPVAVTVRTRMRSSLPMVNFVDWPGSSWRLSVPIVIETR
jgi:hypothetical protein